MLQAIDFLSRRVFEETPVLQDMIAISIGDPDQSPPAILARYPHALRLQALDVESQSLAGEGLRAMLESIVDFVIARHVDNRRWRLVIHCEGGVSRSAAVALIAHHLTGAHFPRWPDANYANLLWLSVADDLLEIPIPRPRAEPEELVSCWLAI